MRYASPDNFTGAPVPGYVDGECILTRATAEALARVQQDLETQDLSLKVYDCYRPVTAVSAFMAWVQGATDTGTGHFYPATPRRELIRRGYIASTSMHSRGIAIDLTLVPRSTREESPPDGRATAPCTAPVGARAADTSLDMGTSFDCFDIRSHVHAPGLTAEQRKWREVLSSAMVRRGFWPYKREWWHFSYPAGGGGALFDVPVTAER